MTNQRLKLLIVDDEEAHVEAIRRAFDEAGGNVEIESAASLHAFRVSVVAQPPDLALMDLNLPDGRALEVLTHPPEDAPFPVLVMTAFGNQQLVVEVMKAGALDYVVKSPAAFANLPRTVEHALREWELLQKNKRAEAALRASEASLQSILGSTAEGILALAEDGQVLKYNQQFVELWRLPHALLAAGDGSGIRQFILNQLTQPQEVLQKAQRLHTTDQVSCDTVTFKDGRFFECRSAPLLIAGAVKGRVWSFSDITARERAEATLHHSERNYREIYNAANDAIFIHDADTGAILDVNDSMLAVYGYTREEALGLTADRTCAGTSPYSAAEAHQWMGKAVVEGPQVFEWHARKKNGELFWVEVALKCASISGQRRLLAVVRDITERKQAAEALRHMAQRFQAILNKQHYGILVANAAGMVEFVNQAFCDLMALPDAPESLAGLSSAQMLPKILSAYADPDATLAAIQTVVARAEPLLDTEIPMADGRVLLVDFVPLVIAGQQTGRLWLHRDITERKRAEAVLRKNEEQLKFALEGANDGLWDVDLLTNSVYLSPRGCEMFGYRPDEFMAQVEQWNQMVHPDDLPATQAALADYMSGRAPLFQIEQRLRTKTGAYRWILTRGKVSGRDAAGQPVRMTGTHTDITERKRAETALRESEARLVRAQSVAHIGSWELNLATLRIWASAEALRIYGYEQDQPELPLETVQGRVIAEDRPQLDAALRALWSGGEPYNQEYRITRANDGAERTIHSMATVESEANGHPGKVVGTLQDITERKLAHEAQARLATAVEQAAETIVITDPAGTIVYANPAFEKITGYSRAEALGQNPRLLKSGKHDAAFYRRMWETLLAGQVWSGRIINKRKDGKLIEEEATLSPVVDAAGKLINFVAVKRDVTREVALEVQNRQAAKMEAVGQLAGGVAHDFNNQLQVILGSAEVILESVPLESPIREDLQEIQKAARHSADLTRQLLAFSRKQMIAPIVLDVNAAISGSLKMFSRLIGENIRLNFVLARENWRVFMDPSQLDQILANLVVNARDAIAGPGKISIAVANQKLQEDDCREKPDFVTPGDYVVLSVSDDGMGMTPEVQARIFEPFFTTKGVGEGTGMGLATIYGIVKQNHGAIVVQSLPGHGTTFTLYLPRSKDTKHEPADAATEAPRPTGTETVLVVEDQESVLLLVQRTLSRQGYNVLTAPTPRQALQLCEQFLEPIHLLLTDVIMPDMGGMELAERIQALRPGIRVLFMSGYTDDIMQQQGHLPASHHVLQKPFPAATLAQLVRAMLDAPSAPPPT